MTFTANLKTLFVSIFSGITTLLLIPTTALAGAFYNGWTYSVDSFNDSVEGDAVGNTVYEIFATAVRQTEQEIIFAINSNLPVSGVNNPYAEDGYTEWGDLLINATGQSLNTASDNSLLFGLHFAPNNGAGVSELGFYGGVRAKSVAQENGLLLSNFAAYNNYVQEENGSPTLGDLPANTSYVDQSRHIPNIIESGVKISDLNFIYNLGELGLNFPLFGATGTQTFAFSVPRSAMPESFYDLIYTLAAACNNDPTAGIFTFEPVDDVKDVPEPSSLFGLGIVGLVLGNSRLFRRNR